MKEKKINNDFDVLTVAKMKGSFTLKAVVFLALACIISAFIFSFMVLSTAYSKIAVIDTGGRYLQTTIEDAKDLQKALILQSCSNLSYYINSFDMNGYLDNYNRARSYCTVDELNKITEFYKGERLYFDALERGVIFKTEINTIHEVSVNDSGRVFVKFNSVMTKIDGTNRILYLIESEGVLEKIKPQFPDNTTGYFFSQYIQQMKPFADAKQTVQDE